MSWELMSYGELMSGGTNVLDSFNDISLVSRWIHSSPEHSRPLGETATTGKAKAYKSPDPDCAASRSVSLKRCFWYPQPNLVKSFDTV